MAILLEAFPKVSRELLVKSGYIATKFKFGFGVNGEMMELKSSPTDASTSKMTVLQLEDSACKWHPEEYELEIECSSTINTPSFLFGEKGLAALDQGIIGVAIIWMATDSGVRGVREIGELSHKTAGPAVINGRIMFPSQLLRGTLILQTALFLKSKGNISASEQHLAHNPGTILGVLDETKVLIDGNGSMFPVHTVFTPSEPLWWVICNWEDPTQDQFTDDFFCIYLNSAHKDFGELNVNEGIKSSPLLMEIVCSSLQILVMKVLNDPVYKADTVSGKDLRPGSISSVINYFIHVYGWAYDPDNPGDLAISIRKSLMKTLL